MSETSQANTAPLLLNKNRLVELTSGGPTLHDAATQLLRKALHKIVPGQQIDPDKTMLMSPIWRRRGEELITHSSHFESLTHALARHAFTRETANYIEGEHFLTVTPRAVEPIHLPLSMDALTTLLNEHAPVLFKAFEQSQLDYWNETTEKLPRWQLLSDSLKTALNIHSVNGWDKHECTLARLVSQQPDKALRPTSGSSLSNIRACLLDIDLSFELAEANKTRHLMLLGALILTATLGNRELIVMYTPSGGYETFSSMAQLGAALPARIDVDLSGQSLKWRLYEPDGNIFDAMVWAMVGCQLDAIDALDPASRSPLARIASPKNAGTAITAGDKARIEQLEDAIPEWLLEGSLDDILTYSNYLSDLGALRGEAGSDMFNVSEIPIIHAYARQKMHDAIVADKPGEDAATLRLDDIRISITHSFEAGGFTLPDPHHRSIETLAEFALQNTRPYSATVAYADGTTAPDWMSVTFLLKIANQVNVGETYPQLIKRTLIDDKVQAQRHESRYCRQLPWLLPLLALECKLKRQGDIDEQGYRQVRQLMESIEKKMPASESPVQIRRLAFLPRYRLSKTPDTVANTYIIGPREGQNGPCLLYRPLLDQPLRQFPSEQNMLYAFYQPGELRDSVLAWLPSKALSFDYAQYVFSSGIPSPWTISELAFEPFIHLDLTASITLANTPLDADILATLFKHNSQAMAELADRQSTSNAERRWALLADSGWAMFSVAANFLSGSAGTAVWVWQSINQIQQALDAKEHGDAMMQWSSIGDVLLMLGILLSQRVATRRIRLSGPLDRRPASQDVLKYEPAIITQPIKPATVTHEAMPLHAELPKTHLTALEPATLGRINAGAEFLRQINRFQVPEPLLPDGAQPNANHLYELAGKHYVRVGERLFQVSAETDEPVFIVDPNDLSRSGFGVKYDEGNGRWHWDLKLRLRGGGPTGRIAALRREKARKKEDAWTALHQFIEQEASRKASLDQALKPMESNDLSGTMSEAQVTLYIAKCDELAKGYGQALDHLEQWREAGGAGVFYQSQLMRLTVEQHRFLSGWMRMKLREYARIVAPQLSQSEVSEPRDRATQMEAAKKAIAVSDEIIDRLGRMHASLDRLKGHTGVAHKIANDLQRLLPSFSHLNLEANEIGMSIELSLQETAESELNEIRQIITPIFENAADAGHALVERRTTWQPVGSQALSSEALTALVDRLADAERRLQDVSASSPDRFEPVRFKRVQTLVGELHQRARNRLLRLLPEPEEVPVGAMARLEPVPSTSRAIGKVSKSRPRVVEVEKTPSIETEAGETIPIVRVANRRLLKPATVDDESLVANSLALGDDLNAFLLRTRSDAQRPSRIPADMKDLFDQQATRLEQAAAEVDALLARRSADFPVASLSGELRAGAARARREGINVYGAMLMGRKPRQTYLKWLYEHDQVEIVRDERGRIKTKQRKDFFQEYRILDKTRQNKPLWVAHFHYDKLGDPDDQPTAAHLKFADAYLQELPATTRQELGNFDGVDNALRRIVDPAIRDLFLKAQ